MAATRSATHLSMYQKNLIPAGHTTRQLKTVSCQDESQWILWLRLTPAGYLGGLYLRANDRLRNAIIQDKMASSSVVPTGHPNRIWMGFEGVPNCLIMNPKFRPNWRWCWCFPYINHDFGNLSWGCYKLKDVEACARVLGKSNPCLSTPKDRKHQKPTKPDMFCDFSWYEIWMR